MPPTATGTTVRSSVSAPRSPRSKAAHSGYPTQQISSRPSTIPGATRRRRNGTAALLVGSIADASGGDSPCFRPVCSSPLGIRARILWALVSSMMIAMRIAMSIAVLVILAVAAGTAAAGPMLTPITDRNYTLDMWSTIPFGDSAALATGGANVARAVGSSGALDNPAASSISKATDDVWGVDYHIDYLNGSLSSDYGNTGIQYSQLQNLTNPGQPVTNPDQTSQQLTLGAAVRVYNWGLAASVTARSMNLGSVTDTDGTKGSLYAESLLLKGSLAHFFEGPDIALGIGVQAAVLNMQIDCQTPECGNLFTVGGYGAQFGMTWIPHLESFRVGAVLSTGISNDNITGGSCTDPTNCEGYILPEKVTVPATVNAGIAYRFAPTPWNQHVPTRFRDEMSLTLEFDVLTNAPVENGYGLDAFAIHDLE